MIDVGLFYPRLMKGFIVNLPKGFNDAKSYDYRKFHVRGYYFDFSPAIINEYLGKGKLIIMIVPPIKIIAKEITGNIHDNRLSKGRITESKVIVKYANLYKMGVAN